MGRPSKLTDETVEKLVEMIELGATYAHACNYAGVSYDSFNSWRNQGKNAKNGKYLKFLNIIKKAEGNATRKWLKVIEDAAEESRNWVAAAWLLERRYPDDFGKQIRQKVESRNINYDISELTEEQLKRLAETGDDSDIVSNK